MPRRALLLVGLAVTVIAVLASIGIVTGQGRAGSYQLHARAVNPPPHIPLAPTTLSWDDGSIETALGINGLSGQHWGVRFGQAAATTGAVPFRVLSASWYVYNVYPINSGLLQVFNGAATSSLASTAAGGGGGYLTAGFASGPTITSANGSFVGALWGVASGPWYLGIDTGTPYSRGYWGTASNAFVLGGGTLQGICSGQIQIDCNPAIRMVVDANIPVELESFEID